MSETPTRVYLVFTQDSEDGRLLEAAFSTLRKAHEYIRKQFTGGNRYSEIEEIEIDSEQDSFVLPKSLVDALLKTDGLPLLTL